MLKKIFISLILSISLLFFLTTLKLNKIDKKENVLNNLPINNFLNLNIAIGQKEKEKKEQESEIIGKLIIKKININNNLYNTSSKKNNVNENITILNNSIPPENENSIMFIAAHSGTGKLAYFKDLNKLKEGDEIGLIYDNKNYTYIVKNYWEEEKNGYINVLKEPKNQLILTTCSPDKENKQLIINAIAK